jgi:glycine cleavage system H protein
VERILNESTIPADLYYSSDHLWIKEDKSLVVVGITHHAQDLLGDIVYVELPIIGYKTRAGVACAIVESVKTASDIIAPLSGEVVEVNAELSNVPQKINESPYAAWVFKMKPSNEEEKSRLLDAAAYQKLVDSEAA